VAGDRYQLTVRARDETERGSRYARRARREGIVPGVLYGKGHTRAIAVHERELRTALTGSSGLNAIVDVVIEGQTTPHHAVLKEYQQHPIRGTITHFDFHEVRLDQPIHAVVIVQLVGESAGVKLGGVLQQVTREINVEALPMNVPERVDADITELEIGGTLRLEDLDAVEGVTFLDDPHETVVATISAPRVAEELPEEELAEGEEVEVAEGEEVEAAAEAEASEGEPPAEE
jgi:large subunit ribosomal protein L25